MAWHVIITKNGVPLQSAEGDPILFPGKREAKRWLMPGDLRIELWRGAVKPQAPIADHRQSIDE